MAKKQSSRSMQPSTLRERAEAALRITQSDIAGMPTGEIQKLVHELQVHQIELHIQNEELLASQSELAQSRDRLSDLYDFAPIGYLTLDQDGTVVEANLTAASMLGIERQKLVNRRLTQFVAPAGQDTLYHHQRAALDCAVKQTSDLLLRRKDGTTFFARMETVCFRESVTHACHCRSAIIDITQQKLAEKQLAQANATLEDQVAERTESLRASEEQLAGIIESAMDAIISVDAGMRVILFNAAAQKMFQCSATEAMGRLLDTFIPFCFHGDHTAHIQHFCEADATSYMIGTIGPSIGLRRDGKEFPIEASTSQVSSHGHKIYTVILRDISDRQRLEEALLRAGEQERQRIGHDLHDGLGQEIMGIALLTDMLQAFLKTKALPEAAMVERLAELLKHAKNEVRRISYGLQPVAPDPDGLMAGIRNLIADANLVNDTKCVFSCNKNVAMHNHESSNHLYRIAQEAMQNALRHGKPKEVIVRLTRNEERVILEVQDDGDGIAMKAVKSQGIGLRTMKYRAEAMNGFLDLIRPPEGGTLVRCSIPDPQYTPQNEKTSRSEKATNI